MLNGTAGFIFPPDVKKEHNLTAFISELYRYIVSQVALLSLSLALAILYSNYKQRCNNDVRYHFSVG